jgi:hypothetical protein
MLKIKLIYFVDACYVFGKMFLEVSAHRQLPHGVKRPNILTSRIKINEWWICMNLISDSFILHRLLGDSLFIADFISIYTSYRIHKKDVFIGSVYICIKLFIMKITRCLSKQWQELSLGTLISHIHILRFCYEHCIITFSINLIKEFLICRIHILMKYHLFWIGN